jgi:hypothetical protein
MVRQEQFTDPATDITEYGPDTKHPIYAKSRPWGGITIMRGTKRITLSRQECNALIDAIDEYNGGVRYSTSTPK